MDVHGTRTVDVLRNDARESDVVAAKPVDPHVVLLQVEATLSLNGSPPGKWYDRKAAIKAVGSLLGALDIPCRTLAESTAAARRAAGLAEALP